MNSISLKNILLKSILFGVLIFVVNNSIGWILGYEFDLLASLFGAVLATIAFFGFERMGQKEK